MILAIGAHGNGVAVLQQKLQSLGFDPGAIDDDFGPKTQAAVIKFQLSKHLLGDGIVGPITQAALNGEEHHEPPVGTDPGTPGSLDWYFYLWGVCKLREDSVSHSRLQWCLTKIRANQKRYEGVAAKTGVPWQLIAAIHGLEASYNFNTYLGNGDPLHKVSTHVPAGRGPFATWEDGAVDALRFDGLAGRDNWGIPKMLQQAERYNGTGYLKYHPTVKSPYLWSGTNIYSVGKYVADGRWDGNAKSDQTGVAAIFKGLGMA